MRRSAVLALCLAWGCSYDPSGVPLAPGDDDDDDDAPPVEIDAAVDPERPDATVTPDPIDAGRTEIDAEEPDREIDAGDVEACQEYDCHDPDCAPCGDLQVCCDDGTCAGLGLCL